MYLAGMVLAVLRVRVPYIPTAKEAQRGRFLRLAWPHLALAGFYALTLGHTLRSRLLFTPEGALVLSSEAVWGMVGFASLAVAMVGGGIVAAWQSRSLPNDAPWDDACPSLELPRK
jgi:hypothetical protein